MDLRWVTGGQPIISMAPFHLLLIMIMVIIIMGEGMKMDLMEDKIKQTSMQAQILMLLVLATIGIWSIKVKTV